jgi:hypothetical protein
MPQRKKQNRERERRTLHPAEGKYIPGTAHHHGLKLGEDYTIEYQVKSSGEMKLLNLGSSSQTTGRSLKPL